MFYYFHTEYDPNDKTLNNYNVFMNNPEQFDKYQTIQGFDKFLNAKYIVFFVKTPNLKEAVFVGIYEKLAPPIQDETTKQFIYELKKCEELQAGSGRLFVEDPATTADFYYKSGTIREKGGLPILRITAPSSHIK